jgi:hypothetical protein
VEFIRAFHDLKTAAARQRLAAEFGNDARHQIGVLFVFDWVDDPRMDKPIRLHFNLLNSSWAPIWARP